MEIIVEHETVLDPTQQRVGEIYARALLGVGQKSGGLDELLSQLDSYLDDVLSKLPKFRQAMESPRIAVDQKEQWIDSSVGDKGSREFKNFLKILARKGRFECLPAVRRAAHKLYNEYSGRVEATLITAAPIDDESRVRAAQQLAQRLGKEIDLRTQVNPEILAGSVIRVGDTVYDDSIKNQLQRARSSGH